MTTQQPPTPIEFLASLKRDYQAALEAYDKSCRELNEIRQQFMEAMAKASAEQIEQCTENSVIPKA